MKRNFLAGFQAQGDSKASDGTLQLRVTLTYDVFGNRIMKEVDSNGDGTIDTTDRYWYDGWKTGSPQPYRGNENWDIYVDEVTTAGAGFGPGPSVSSTYYLRDSRIDSLLARFGLGSTNVYWTAQDRQMSVRNVLDSNGVNKDVITYDGYGKIASETDASFRGRYTWTGRELDVETGLRYNRARYYDPNTGKWISQDPLGFDAGDSNLYRYVHNRHPMATDPSGLWEEDIHFYMTYYIARSLGMHNMKKEVNGLKSNEAFLIAWAANYVDFCDLTQPVQAGVALPWSSHKSRDIIETFHFYRTSGNVVIAGSKDAKIPVTAGIKKGDPLLVGIGLHILQDNFSHHNADFQHLFPTEHAPKLRPEFGGHGCDLPWNNKQKAKQTAEATFDTLIDYLKRDPREFEKWEKQTYGGAWDDRFWEPGWDLGKAKAAALSRLKARVIGEVVPLFETTAFNEARKRAERNSDGASYGDKIYQTDLKVRLDGWLNAVQARFEMENGVYPSNNSKKYVDALRPPFVEASKEVTPVSVYYIAEYWRRKQMYEEEYKRSKEMWEQKKW